MLGAMRALLFIVALGACSKPDPSQPEASDRAYSYCDCDMWGVSGVEPPPDHPPPPPRPAACEEILRGPEPDGGCPVPP
jgi:hypothetical protein